MKDVQTAIVLAAGSSRRMGALTTDRPKSMLPFRGQPILARLLGQIQRAGVERTVVVTGFCGERVRDLIGDLGSSGVTCVHNARYAEDTNIESMRLALGEVSGSVAIFEADTVMEDSLVRYVVGTDFEGESVWFTKGRFRPEQSGGIVKSDADGLVCDIRVVPAYAEQYAEHSKMTGLMRIAGAQLDRFRAAVTEFAARTLAQYFFTPLAAEPQAWPAREGNAEHFRFHTFNTPDDYAALEALDLDDDAPRPVEVELVDPRQLLHIEDYDRARVELLRDVIVSEGRWTQPMVIERDHGLVLDGQHRLEVALALGLQRVPVIRLPYADVAVWTLRKPELVSAERVIERARRRDLYPYKTVKHKFPALAWTCDVPLDELRR